MDALAESADEALWHAALAESSADAWGELFRRHHRAIYNFCFRRTGEWGAAEDLTSAVFLEAWRRRRETRATTAGPLPWLFGIATMLTRNHHRALRRYRSALARIPPADPGHDLAEEVTARIDAQHRAAIIRQALSRLPRTTWTSSNSQRPDTSPTPKSGWPCPSRWAR